ncbi:MAG: hypothetical protein ACI8W8_003205 [Rhodothermales bacterium]|jgi:hypothetical protein
MSMHPKHDKISRRSMLRAAGISLALPWFESLAGAPESKPPKRFCSVYFPYGASSPKPDQDGAEWGWLPAGEGRDFTFNKSLEVLEPMRDQLTILGGLSHTSVRKIGGHDSADTFLTGEALSVNSGLKNTISLDQFMARTHGLGEPTRFPSLVLSNDGGVGMPTRANTLSYSHSGQPIPSLNRPGLVFERLFALNSNSIDAQRQGLSRTGSHLDLLRGQAKRLHSRLGGADKDKLDQYLTSVREVEQNVERASHWLTVPRAKVDATDLSMEADNETPDDLIRTMFDLMVLAFQTDSTRFATYQLGSMHGAISIANKFPSLLGFGKDAHGLAHGMKKTGGAKAQGEWDRFLATHLHRFLDRMAKIPEGDGSLLDNTCVFYGSSNSTTHSNLKYPLLIAGGKSMGYTHGQYLKYDSSTPLANLFVTMQKRMGVQADSFADSTGELSEV